MSYHRKAATGFIPLLSNLGDSVWEVQWADEDVMYSHPEFGAVRISPDSFTRYAETLVGRPTTLNHSDTINGRITKSLVEDGKPIVRFQVDKVTNAMMEKDGWNGGVSPAFYPEKLVEDLDGPADYLATEWEFEALGIGDGTLNPACPQGVCDPKKVEGMADDPMSAEELAKQRAAGEAARLQKEAEKAAEAAKAKAEEQEAMLKELKAGATEDTMKVFETLLDARLKPLEEERDQLTEQLKKVTSSEEDLKKFQTEREAKDLKDLIAKLPADSGVDYTTKSLDELREMVKFADHLATKHAPPPKGDAANLPEADPPTGDAAGLDGDIGGRTAEEVRAYNKLVKARHTAKPRK